MNFQAKPLEKRLQQHFMSDGLMELILGGWLVLMSLVFLLIHILNLPMILFHLTMIVLPLSLGPGLQFLKKRLTDPRIGHIRYNQKKAQKQNTPSLLAGMLSLLLIFALFTGLVMFQSEALNNVVKNWFHFIPFIMMLFFSSVLFYMGWYYDISRLFVSAVIITFIGLVSIFFPTEISFSIAITMGLSGLALFVIGLYTLTEFIRQNPIAGTEMTDIDNYDF